MDPRDFLNLARQLAAGADAAHHRSAISRAYYAVYNVAFDLLLGLGFSIDRGHGAHEAVQDHLSNSGVDNAIHVGTQLRRFQHVRVKADYWMLDPQPERDPVITYWLQRAERMVTMLDTAAADATVRERMFRAIQTWEGTRRRPRP